MIALSKFGQCRCSINTTSITPGATFPSAMHGSSFLLHAPIYSKLQNLLPLPCHTFAGGLCLSGAAGAILYSVGKPSCRHCEMPPSRCSTFLKPACQASSPFSSQSHKQQHCQTQGIRVATLQAQPEGAVYSADCGLLHPGFMNSICAECMCSCTLMVQCTVCPFL